MRVSRLECTNQFSAPSPYWLRPASSSPPIWKHSSRVPRGPGLQSSAAGASRDHLRIEWARSVPSACPRAVQPWGVGSIPPFFMRFYLLAVAILGPARTLSSGGQVGEEGKDGK